MNFREIREFFQMLMQNIPGKEEKYQVITTLYFLRFLFIGLLSPHEWNILTGKNLFFYFISFSFFFDSF